MKDHFKISDSKVSVIAKGFQVLIDTQRELQLRAYDKDPLELEGDDFADFVRWNAFALEDELHEALSEVGWKPWATSRHVNKEAFAKELVDLLHFFANLCLATGVSGQDLAKLYNEKRAKNLRRQQEGYTGVKEKCPRCGRDYDESRCSREGENIFCQEMEPQK